MKTRASITKLGVILATLSLGACGGGEPSESDIQAALQAQINQALDAAMGAAGNSPEAREMAAAMIPSIKSVKKLGCKEDSQKSGFNCDLQIVTTTKMGGDQTGTSSGRFVKGDKGWIVAQ
jgi:hypothetical protein